MAEWDWYEIAHYIMMTNSLNRFVGSNSTFIAMWT